MTIRLEEMSFGLELEVGDVHRSVPIPPGWGMWENSETDVVNILPPFAHVCCDPLGINPPVGGEINLRPCSSPSGLARRFLKLRDYLITEHRQCPTFNCISHTHIHVHVPGLTEDVDALKRLTRYIFRHQDWVADRIHAFQEVLGMEEVPKARSYLKWDGARRLPEWLAQNIEDKADSFERFIDLHCCGKDGVSRGRPFRYMINMYALKHTQTVEFRFFRHTLLVNEIHSCALFAERFMRAALAGNLHERPQVSDLQFPPFRFSLPECQGWEKTKKTGNPDGKVRQFWSPT